MIYIYKNINNTIKGYNICKDNSKIKLESTLNDEDIFSVSIRIDYIKALSNSLLSDTVKIYADKENDLIYFLENDYLHVQGWVIKVIELFRTHKDKYVSLYDHADKYFDYDKLESKIIATSNCHWRTTPSTCGSYIINRNIYRFSYFYYDGVWYWS